MGLLNKLMGKKEEDTSNKTANTPSKPPMKPSSSQNNNSNQDDNQDLTGPTSIPDDSDVASMIGDDSSPTDKTKNNKVLNPADALLKKQSIDQDSKNDAPTVPSKPPMKKNTGESSQSKPSQDSNNEDDAMEQLKKSIGSGSSKPDKPKNNTEEFEDENATYEIPDFDDDLDIDIDVDDIIGEAKNRKNKKPMPEPEEDDDDLGMMFDDDEDEIEEIEDTPVKSTKKLPRFDVNEAQISKELGYAKGNLFINRLKYADILRKEQSLNKDLRKLNTAVTELKNLATQGNEEYEEFNHNLHEVQDDVMRIDYMIFEAKR